jgi:hypothetical protein
LKYNKTISDIRCQPYNVRYWCPHVTQSKSGASRRRYHFSELAQLPSSVEESPLSIDKAINVYFGFLNVHPTEESLLLIGIWH